MRGKFCVEHCIARVMDWVKEASAWMGRKEVFEKLMDRPVARANSSRIVFRVEAASWPALIIRIVSSVYCNVTGGLLGSSGWQKESWEKA